MVFLISVITEDVQALHRKCVVINNLWKPHMATENDLVLVGNFCFHSVCSPVLNSLLPSLLWVASAAPLRKSKQTLSPLAPGSPKRHDYRNQINLFRFHRVAHDAKSFLSLKVIEDINSFNSVEGCWEPHLGPYACWVNILSRKAASVWLVVIQVKHYQRHSNFHGVDFNVLRIVKPEKKYFLRERAVRLTFHKASNHLFLRSFLNRFQASKSRLTHDNYYLWIITRSEPLMKQNDSSKLWVIHKLPNHGSGSE